MIERSHVSKQQSCGKPIHSNSRSSSSRIQHHGQLRYGCLPPGSTAPQRTAPLPLLARSGTSPHLCLRATEDGKRETELILRALARCECEKSVQVCLVHQVPLLPAAILEPHQQLNPRGPVCTGETKVLSSCSGHGNAVM